MLVEAQVIEDLRELSRIAHRIILLSQQGWAEPILTPQKAWPQRGIPVATEGVLAVIYEDARDS